MKIRISLIVLLFCTSLSHSQTRSTVSATCGKCGKPVAATSKVGDICPHCGVRWGYENSTTTNKYEDNTRYFPPPTNISPIRKHYRVVSTKAFFYTYPNSNSRRKAYLVQGDIVEVLQELDEYVYIEYINPRGQMTKGWIQKVELFQD